MKIEYDKVKITLDTGKVIELTQGEFDELKNGLKEHADPIFPYTPPWGIPPSPYTPYPNIPVITCDSQVKKEDFTYSEEPNKNINTIEFD